MSSGSATTTGKGGGGGGGGNSSSFGSNNWLNVEEQSGLALGRMKRVLLLHPAFKDQRLHSHTITI